MVFLQNTTPKPYFCEVKVGFWLQNHLLRGKTKKPKKPSFLENGEGILKKMFFLVLPCKKMVFHRKTNFSHVKRWFWCGLPQENHLFARVKVGFWLQNHLLRGKTKKPKKPSFLENGEGILKKMVFLVLPREKMVFHSKTNFSHVLVKDGFGAKNQLSPRKKMVFLRQSTPKPSFYVGKVGFSMKNHLFTMQNPKKTIFFNIPSPFSKKDGFLGFLVSRVSASSLVGRVGSVLSRDSH